MKNYPVNSDFTKQRIYHPLTLPFTIFTGFFLWENPHPVNFPIDFCGLASLKIE